MLARNDDLKARLEAAPEWDLIVCDEAHRMSASFFGQEVLGFIDEHVEQRIAAERHSPTH